MSEATALKDLREALARAEAAEARVKELEEFIAAAPPRGVYDLTLVERVKELSRDNARLRVMLDAVLPEKTTFHVMPVAHEEEAT